MTRRNGKMAQCYWFSPGKSALSQGSLSSSFAVLRSSGCHVSILLTNARNILLSWPSILLIELPRLKVCGVRSVPFNLPVSRVNKRKIEFTPVSKQGLTLRIIEHWSPFSQRKEILWWRAQQCSDMCKMCLIVIIWFQRINRFEKGLVFQWIPQL